MLPIFVTPTSGRPRCAGSGLYLSVQGLRYVAEYKDLDEPLRDFIVRRGGINTCASRFARRLGRRSIR